MPGPVGFSEAMVTRLLTLSAASLSGLMTSPDAVNRLSSPRPYSTHIGAAIAYFLGRPAGSERLSQALEGSASIECTTLENGYFFVVPPEQVSELLGLLRRVDVARFRQSILDADLEDLLDGELSEEIELAGLYSSEEAAEEASSDLQKLIAFYAEAADEGLALVGYTG